ncbi:hypothetical protein K492DRAFT_172029 [Lichtheimia hyalospora FSU 10163]|nr:hypothetical protein K492DRAFT_172029 [Lichtheimia hyalospora FSU 10163]
MASSLPTPVWSSISQSLQDESSSSTKNFFIRSTSTSISNTAVPTTDAIDNDDSILIDDEPTMNPSPRVQIDRFAQLVATHWQYDHLESIKTSSYDNIAKQMREHVEIMIQPSSSAIEHSDNDDAMTTSATAMPDDAMDVDILKAQIFGAIQAHIGGDLPLAWDELGDQLSQPAIETYVRSLVLKHCPQTGDHVDHTCLNEYGEQILSDLDDYVAKNVADIFGTLNREFVPDLLTHTEKDLRQVLDYFNTAFFHQSNDQEQDGMQLTLRVLPWKHAGQNKMAAFFSSSSNADSSDRHSHKINQYADLAIV